MKYIIYENKEYGEVPIVFPNCITHSDMAFKINPKVVILSAGFCKIENNSLVAYGKSTSLEVVSRKIDSNLLTLMAEGD